MIKINLQWFAIPFIAYAIYAIFIAINCLIQSIGTPDIGPIIGISVASQYGFYALCSTGIAFLIYRAFK